MPNNFFNKLRRLLKTVKTTITKNLPYEVITEGAKFVADWGREQLEDYDYKTFGTGRSKRDRLRKTLRFETKVESTSPTDARVTASAKIGGPDFPETELIDQEEPFILRPKSGKLMKIPGFNNPDRDHANTQFGTPETRKQGFVMVRSKQTPGNWVLLKQPPKLPYAQHMWTLAKEAKINDVIGFSRYWVDKGNMLSDELRDHLTKTLRGRVLLLSRRL